MNANGRSLIQQPQQNTGVASWQHSLRSAMFDAITEKDVKEIVQNLVTKAKEGDRQAVRMVFDYVLGGAGGPKIENSNVVIQAPTKPTKARAGTSQKLRVLASRVSNGEEMWHEADGKE